MLDDVDIYAPFRDNGNEEIEGMEEKIAEIEEDEEGVIYAEVQMQTIFGFTYCLRIPCKPSKRDPEKPSPIDFIKKMEAIAANYDPDEEAEKIYRGLHRKISRQNALKVAASIQHILKTMTPSQYMRLLKNNNGAK